ncbi:protein kinase [Fibrobacterota bacterium]
MTGSLRNYEISDLVFRSSESEVYLAREKQTDNQYLIKSLTGTESNLNQKVGLKKRFKQEADLVSSFEHPNISRLVDSYYNGNAYCLVYPFRHGNTLSFMLGSKRELPLPFAVSLMLQLLDALEYIHSRGIIHCDINPRNIFISKDNQLELFDFGCSLREDEAAGFSEGMLIGTIPYLAPEQLGITGLKLDSRTDLFCAALIFYRMVSGELPVKHQGVSVEEYSDLILKTEIPPVKNVPLSFNRILMKALKPTPSERYQTATGFIHDLKIAAQEMDGIRQERFVVGERDSIIAVNREKLFVGRSQELESLERSLAGLFSGHPSSHLFYGVSGIGKTEIVNQFKARIKKDRFFVLSTKCNRFTASQPFSAFRDLMLEMISLILQSPAGIKRKYRRQINEELQEYSGIICQIVPEMKTVFTQVRPVEEIEKEKEADRLIQVLFTFFRILAGLKPMVVFIDDLQWIDKTSFQIIKKLMEEKTRCMLIFNYRTEDDKANLFLFREDLRKLELTTLKLIGTFSKAEIKDLVDLRFGDFTNAGLMADALYSRTDQSPFTLTESIRFLVNNNVLKTGTRGWHYEVDELLSLPQKFDSLSLILKKLENLPYNAKQYLQMASLIEGQFFKNIIEKLGVFAPETSKGIVNQLLRQGILSRRMQGGFYFSHDKVKESISSSIPREQKLALHERLGEIYVEEALENKEMLFPAAEHFLKTRNLSKAVALCDQAGAYARQKLSHELAIHYFKLASFMVTQCGQLNIKAPVEMPQIQKKLAEVLALTGKNTQALRIYLDLLKGKKFAEKNENLELKYNIGSIYHNMGEFENSIPFFKEALVDLRIRLPLKKSWIATCLFKEIIIQIVYVLGLRKILQRKKDLKSFFRVRILNKLSYSLYFDDMVTAFYVHFKALNLADRLDDSFEKSEAYTSHVIPSYQLMFQTRALSYFNKSLGIGRRIHRKDSYAFAQSFGGLLYYYKGDWKKSEECLWASIKNYDSIGDMSGQMLSSEHIWKVDLMRADFDSAEKHMKWTIDICTKAKEKYFLLVTMSALNLVKLLKTGNEKEEDIKKIEKSLEQINSFLTHIEVGSYLSQIELLQNKIDKTYKRVKNVLPIIKSKSFNAEYSIPIFSVFCEVLIKELINRRKHEPQIHMVDKKLKKELLWSLFNLRFSCVSFPSYWGSYYRNVAWYKTIQKKYKSAEIFIKKAIQRHHSLDMKYEEAKSIRDYGLFFEERNLPGDARDQFEKAYKLFSQCGAKLEMSRLRDKVGGELLVQPKTIAEREMPQSDFMSTISLEPEELRMDAFFDVSNSLTRLHDIESLLKQIVKSLIKATGAQNGYLFMKENENIPARTVLMNYEGRILTHEQVHFSNDILHWVKRNKETMLVKDGESDDRIKHKDCGTIRSVLCVPLIRNDNFLGCVYLSNDRIAGLFSEQSKKAAQILTSQASVLLENAYLLESYKKLNTRLESKVNRQTSDIRSKNEQLEKYNMQLLESERMKNILTGTIVHDIKNYVAGIEGNLKVLKRRYSEKPDGLRSINTASDACMDIAGLAYNLLDIGKMEEGRLELACRAVGYNDIFSLMDPLQTSGLFREKRISVQINPPSGSFEIECDYTLLNRVLQNLFNNAAKYTPDKGSVEVFFETGEKENIISIFNSGEPIAEEYQGNLFEKYTRVNDKWSQYSKGLGLFFCKIVMDAHNGRIWLETDENGNYFKLAFQKVLQSVPAGK